MEKFWIFTPCNSSYGKVMFLHMSVSHSFHGATVCISAYNGSGVCHGGCLPEGVSTWSPLDPEAIPLDLDADTYLDPESEPHPWIQRQNLTHGFRVRTSPLDPESEHHPWIQSQNLTPGFRVRTSPWDPEAGTPLGYRGRHLSGPRGRHLSWIQIQNLTPGFRVRTSLLDLEADTSLWI